MTSNVMVQVCAQQTPGPLHPCRGTMPRGHAYILEESPEGAHPLGQPVMRMTMVSPGRPTLSRRARTRRLMSGRPRSASVIARPHSGSAGQAMALRSRLSSSDGGTMPAAVSSASIACFHAGLMSHRRMFWFGVRRTERLYSSITYSPTRKCPKCKMLGWTMITAQTTH